MTQSRKKAQAFFSFCILFVGLMLAGCASTRATQKPLLSASNQDEALSLARELVARRIKEHKITGLSMVLVDTDSIIMLEAFGKADRAKDFSVDTISNIGSVSKLFTGLAIMRLVEDGQVDLDAPLSTYVPDFSPLTWGPDPDGVSIRAIMSHQSGLQSDIMNGFMPGVSFQNNVARPYAKMAEEASKTTLCWEPYTVWSYSNLGISLLALVVENVSGSSFNEFVRTELLKPLGMVDSTFEFDSLTADRYARGYESRRWIDMPGIRDAAAGSMVSSAREMGNFLQAVLKTAMQGQDQSGGGILHPGSLQTMWTRQNSHTRLDFDFVQLLSWYGVESQTEPSRTFIGHGGDLPPYHAHAMLDAESGLGVAFMINGGNADSGVLQDLSRDLLLLFAEPAGSAPMQPSQTLRDRPVQKVPDEVAARVSGCWASSAGLLVAKTGHRGLQFIFNGLPVDLEYRGSGYFSLQPRLLGIIPLNIPFLQMLEVSLTDLENGKYMIIRQSGGINIVLEKIEAEALGPAWQSRMGKWVPVGPESPAPDFSAKSLELMIDSKSGIACLRIDRGGKQLSPVAARSDTELFFRGYGRNLGETVRLIVEDGTEYLEWSGYRYRKR
ncbi:MAG: beta-lactamase family protein [Spirochaetes bacterium]|nr:beta-lactamase family protein [Spirochaetota bacterium]MBU0956405.1 beta-lactamase family protein [Spirochaetota bacterium]